MSGSDPGKLTVRRARVGDELVLRDLRLRALREEPEAFGSTYEREVARTIADWQGWMSPGVTFVLYDSAGAQGMVAGVMDAADSAVVHLMAMWVNPEMRGTGGADELVQALMTWACSVDAKRVRLKVIEGNDRARRFYERKGFRPTGEKEIRGRDSRIEVLMERLADALHE